MKGTIIFAVLTTSTLISTTHYAGTMGLMLNDKHVVLSLGGGVGFTQNIGAYQYIPIINPLTDSFYSYSPTHSNQNFGFEDLFVGLEWMYNPTWSMQLGLDYTHQGRFAVNGVLVQGADLISADQYTYHYSFSSNQLMAQAKLLYLYNERFLPYINLGLGSAINTARNFQTNTPPFLTFTREYTNNTQHSFTYTAGLGIDTVISQHLRLGLGYRFSDLGKVQLGNARIDTTVVGGALGQQHLYVNALIAQLTFII